jgi:phosphatidylserine/phosphatidylglycerophosphate/cardiolipin synthase-like enzyme
VTMATGLSKVPMPVLERLLRLVTAGTLRTPLTETALQAHGLGGCWADLAWLASLDQAGVAAVMQAVLAERMARPLWRTELVWTGPETRVSAARDTAVVVRELFSKARQSVLLAGFAFTDGKCIFAPLHEAMRDRGVQARLFLHLNDLSGCGPDESARIGTQRFLAENWPFGDPIPAIYYDPRTVSAGSSVNLHAKCVVVDERWTLIGSANFTHNAQARNIEVGVLIDDPGFAQDLVRQWLGLVEAGLVASAARAATRGSQR